MASISAVDLIKRSLTMLGVFGEGETLDAFRAEQAKTTLNYLLERWNMENISVYCHETTSFPLVVGQSSYTIGEAGVNGTPDINATRPTQIEYMFLRQGTIDLPITQVTLEEWWKIPNKSINVSYPLYFCYDHQFPFGVIRFSEQPISVFTIYFTHPKAFTAVSSLSTSINYPEGYARAIETNLAVELGVFYPGKVSAELASAAREAKEDVDRLNYTQNRKQMYTEHSGIGRGYNVYSIFTMDRLP